MYNNNVNNSNNNNNNSNIDNMWEKKIRKQIKMN